MKKFFNKYFLIILIAFILSVPALSLAHQPRIPEGGTVWDRTPEISKAYYSKLTGQPHIYYISSDKPFALYVNVLTPAIAGQKKDISAAVFKIGNDAPLTMLDGPNFEWKKFFEPFGHDTYWMGPEYKAEVEAGNYEIRVWSTNNDSKYALAVGETEAFDFKETINALNLIPKIKRNFFNESPANFIFSPFGWGLVLIMFILAFAVGFIYRFLIKRLAKDTNRKLHKNIGVKDRLLRLIIGLGLFALAITTTWNPILLFLAGFAFFEAIFSWCGVYAALGKNTRNKENKI